MTHSDGNLSVDFLVGFTIFMVAFIWVATLVPNLFLGVSSHEIDFDAVAYRTGVILVEDPGESSPEGEPWEYWPNSGKDNILRFGLAISKETPNILSRDKVNRFFDTTSFTYDDYRKRVIFGDYPYNFNISLQEVGKDTLYVGAVRPENYGFIRREVRIKGASNATFDLTDVKKFNLMNKDSNPPNFLDGNVSPWKGTHDFSIVINTSRLVNAGYGNVTSPVTDLNASYPNYRAAYQINPRTDWINITMEGFNEFRPAWRPNPPGVDINVNLTRIKFTYTSAFDTGKPGEPPAIYVLGPSAGVPHKNYIYLGRFDETITPVAEPPIAYVEDLQNITFAFPPRFFYNADEGGAIFINMSFEVSTRDPVSGDWMGMQYLNSSQSHPWDYNYNTTEVTPLRLTDAVVEVAVW